MKKFDVCLSFAGEDRPYVEQVFAVLKAAGLSVFYDVERQVDLWATDLTVSLASVYRKDSRFCIAFVSKHYLAKPWPNHERQHALARQLEDDSSYLLPAKLDESELPGLSPTVAYIDCSRLSPEQFASLALQKIGTPSGLPVDEVFLHFAKGQFLVARNQLANIRSSQFPSLTPRQASFVLYNLACANSRAAQHLITTKSERDKLLDNSLEALRAWFAHVEKNKLSEIPDVNSYVQADDDLLFLRKHRKKELSKHLVIVNTKPTGSGGGCVTRGTLISTPLGAVAAEHIYRGHEIWSIDPESRSAPRRVRTLVLDLSGTPQQSILCINEQLMCTAGQRLYSCNMGWIRASELRSGMHLYGEQSTDIKVVSVRELPIPATVYSFRTNHRTHDFFANGYLCHNSKIC